MIKPLQLLEDLFISAGPSLNQLQQGYQLPDLLNLRISLLDELIVKYNLTNVTLTSFSVNSNLFQINFDQQSNTVQVVQDGISIEVQAAYRFFTVPPIYADKGSFHVSLRDVGFSLAFNLSVSEQGQL